MSSKYHSLDRDTARHRISPVEGQNHADSSVAVGKHYRTSPVGLEPSSTVSVQLSFPQERKDEADHFPRRRGRDEDGYYRGKQTRHRSRSRSPRNDWHSSSSSDRRHAEYHPNSSLSSLRRRYEHDEMGRYRNRSPEYRRPRRDEREDSWEDNPPNARLDRHEDYYTKDRNEHSSRRSDRCNDEDDGKGTTSSSSSSANPRPSAKTLLGEPCNTILLRGLSPNTTEDQIEAHLHFLEAAIDFVRLIRDKTTGESRGFAFVTFMSTEHARIWMETHAPSIMIDKVPVTVKYSKTSTEASRGQSQALKSSSERIDWLCSMCQFTNFEHRIYCHQCGKPRPSVDATRPRPKAPTRPSGDDGSLDVGVMPYHILIVRGLDIYTKEETIHATIASQAFIRAVYLVRNRSDNRSRGLAFAEFYDAASAGIFLSMVYQQPGMSSLSIDGRCVAVSYANPASFIPTMEMSEWVAASYPDPSSTTGGLIHYVYRDENAYCVAYPHVVISNANRSLVNAATPSETNGVDASITHGVSEDFGVEPTFPTSSTTQKAIDVPEPYSQQSLKFLESLDDVYTEDNEVVEVISPQNQAAGDALTSSSLQAIPSMSDPGLATMLNPIKPRKPASAKPAVSSQILKWNAIAATKAQEIDDDDDIVFIQERTVSSVHNDGVEEAIEVDDDDKEDNAYRDPERHLSELQASLPSDEDLNYKFTDFKLNACLLCRRQFKALNDVQRHFALSELHKTNLNAHRLTLLAERRGTYTPGTQYGYRSKKSKQKAMVRSLGDDAITQDIQHARAAKVVVGEDNKGHQMLRQMGWSRGEGLGRESTGIIEPIKPVNLGKGRGLGSTSSGFRR